MKLKPHNLSIPLLTVCLMFSGCGNTDTDIPDDGGVQDKIPSAATSMEGPAFVPSSGEHATEPSMQETDGMVQSFDIGGIHYDFTGTDLMFSLSSQDSFGVDDSADGLTYTEKATAKDEDGKKAASVRYYEYKVKDASEWAEPGDNLLEFSGTYRASCSPAFEFDYDPYKLEQYEYVTDDYIIQAAYMPLDNATGQIVFDIIAASRADRLSTGSTAKVWYASIVINNDGAPASDSVTVPWTGMFGDGLADTVIPHVPDDYLAYLMSSSLGYGGFTDRDAEPLPYDSFELYLDTGNTDSSPMVLYKNGETVVDGLLNTSDPDGWKQFTVEPGKTSAKYFKGETCEVQGYNIGNTTSDLTQLPMGAVWMDATAGNLYVDDVEYRKPSDVVSTYGTPWHVSNRIYQGDDTIIHFSYRCNGCYIIFSFRNETLAEVSVLESFYMANAGSLNRAGNGCSSDIINFEKELHSTQQ